MNSQPEPEILRFRLVLTGSEDPAFDTANALIRDGIEGAMAELREIGLEVADAPPTRPLKGDDFGQVLVDYPNAGDPCAAPWRDAIADADPGEVVVLIGGTIRSEVIEVFFSGYGCPTNDVSCEQQTELPTGYILVDGRALDGLDPATFLLHEIGHLAGIDHADTDAPCGADLVPDGADGNLMNSGLHGPAPAGGTFSPQQIAVLAGLDG